MRLNDALIANERYRGEPSTDDAGKTLWPVHVLWDDEVPGLGVRVHPTVRGRPSRKDFIVTWKTGGLKSRTMAIGTYGVDCTLRQARRVAREALDLARRGQDPLEVRQRALGIGTPEDLASRFLFEHSSSKKPKPATGELPGDGVAPGETADAAGSDVPPSLEAVREAAPAADLTSDTEIDREIAGTQAGDAASESPADTSPLAAAESPSPRSASPDPIPTIAAPAAPTPPAAATPKPAAIATPRPAAAAEPAPTPDRPATSPRPRVDDQRPDAGPPPGPKRGPTKVRLLPVPDALYRTLEQSARQSGMTLTAYLNALLDIARAAAAIEVAEPTPIDYATPPPEEPAPSLKEIFGGLEEAQTVSAGGGHGDDDPDRSEG